MERISGNKIKRWLSALYKKEDRPVVKWVNADIPAKLFFEILESGDYTEVGNQDNFMQIFDEYVTLVNDDAIIKAYKKNSRITLIMLKISAIETHLNFIKYCPLNKEDLNKAIDLLNSIEDKPETEYRKATSLVKFSKEKPIKEEIKRIETIILGRLRNELNFEKATLKQSSKDIKYRFEQDIVNIENVLGRTISDDITLRKYVFLKKAAKDKIQLHTKKNK